MYLCVDHSCMAISCYKECSPQLRVIKKEGWRNKDLGKAALDS